MMAHHRPPIPDRTTREQNLINAYEHEEERIIMKLTHKLEQVSHRTSLGLCLYSHRQLRQEKIQLENALEAESESHVNRLTRELLALRRQQQLQQQQQASIGNGEFLQGHDSHSSTGSSSMLFGTETGSEVLEALRRENEQLRSRLVATERDYVR